LRLFKILEFPHWGSLKLMKTMEHIHITTALGQATQTNNLVCVLRQWVMVVSLTEVQHQNWTFGQHARRQWRRARQAGPGTDSWASFLAKTKHL
jgi:hypothetical protein